MFIVHIYNFSYMYIQSRKKELMSLNLFSVNGPELDPSLYLELAGTITCKVLSNQFFVYMLPLMQL